MYRSTNRGESFDVVVVGARLAGAATAMLLARRGFRIALIDRSPVLADTMSTHAFMRAGVLQLHRWGLLDQVRAAGTPPVRLTRFTYADTDISVQIEPQYGVDALYAPRRTIVDRILVEAAAEAGADVRFGHSVTHLERAPWGRISGVSGVRSDGRSFTVSARFVVGADGIGSTVARLVSAPVERRATYATATTYGYWTGARVEGYEWIFQPDAAAGVVSTNNDQVCVFANATPQRIGHGGVHLIESMIGASAPLLAERLRAAAPPSSTRLFRSPAGFMRRAWGDGWALVGDAGYFKDPITAHGMSDALRDAEFLTRALSDVFGGSDEAAGLEEYQRLRDRVSLPLFKITDAIASHQWTSTEIPDLLKRLALTMRDETELLASLDVADVKRAA